VRTYGPYCPIARASELLAERWSFIILRNIVLIGCRTLRDRRGRAGSVSWAAVEAVAGLGARRGGRDPSQARRSGLDLRAYPGGPGFEYPTLSGPGGRGWLLIERGDAEICEKHPGGDEDLVVVVSDPVAFARWDLGELGWSDAVRGGAIEVQGSRALARALPTWKRRVDPVRRPPAARRATTPV
jgi:hypothetical protein